MSLPHWWARNGRAQWGIGGKLPGGNLMIETEGWLIYQVGEEKSLRRESMNEENV